MVPVYAAGYFFGEWVLGLLGVNPLALNPFWMGSINRLLLYYTGLTGISFWSFMIGGNLLGLLFSVILYPVLKLFFTKIVLIKRKAGIS